MPGRCTHPLYPAAFAPYLGHTHEQYSRSAYPSYLGHIPGRRKESFESAWCGPVRDPTKGSGAWLCAWLAPLCSLPPPRLTSECC